MKTYTSSFFFFLQYLQYLSVNYASCTPVNLLFIYAEEGRKVPEINYNIFYNNNNNNILYFSFKTEKKKKNFIFL